MSLLEITGLTHTFGEKLLYRDAELTLNKGEYMGAEGDRHGRIAFTRISIVIHEISAAGA